MIGKKIEIKKKLTWIHRIRGVGGSRGGALQDKTPLQGLAVVKQWQCWPHRALMNSSLAADSTLGTGQTLGPLQHPGGGAEPVSPSLEATESSWEHQQARAGSRSRGESQLESPCLELNWKGHTQPFLEARKLFFLLCLMLWWEMVSKGAVQRQCLEGQQSLCTLHSSGPSGTAVSSAKKLEQNGEVGSYLYSLLPLRSICSKDLLKWESLPQLCCNQKLLSFLIISTLI